MAYEICWCAWQGPSALKPKLAFPNPYPPGTMKNPTRTYKPTHSQIQTRTHTEEEKKKNTNDLTLPNCGERCQARIPLRPPFQTVSTVLLSSHIKGRYRVTTGCY